MITHPADPIAEFISHKVEKTSGLLVLEAKSAENIDSALKQDTEEGLATSTAHSSDIEKMMNYPDFEAMEMSSPNTENLSELFVLKTRFAKDIQLAFNKVHTEGVVEHTEIRESDLDADKKKMKPSLSVKTYDLEKFLLDLQNDSDMRRSGESSQKDDDEKEKKNDHSSGDRITASSMVLSDNFHYQYAIIYGSYSGEIKVAWLMIPSLNEYSTEENLLDHSILHATEWIFARDTSVVFYLAAHHLPESSGNLGLQRIFVSGSMDYTIRVWNLDSETLLLVMHHHIAPVKQIILPPAWTDGQWNDCFLSIGEDGCEALIFLEMLSIERMFPGHLSFPSVVAWVSRRSNLACLCRTNEAADQRARDVHFRWLCHPIIYGKYPNSVQIITNEKLYELMGSPLVSLCSLEVSSELYLEKGVMTSNRTLEKLLLVSRDENADLKAIDFGFSVFIEEGKIYKEIVGNLYYEAFEVLRRNYEIEQDISHGILQGDLDFTSPPWPSIYQGAKDLTRRMLAQDPKKQVMAAQVLEHYPWRRQDGEASTKLLDSTVLNKMKQFKSMNKMKKLELKVENKRLQLMFKNININRSGPTTYDELELGLKTLGSKLSEVEGQQLMDAANVDKDRSTYEEFATMKKSGASKLSERAFPPKPGW